MESVHHLMKTVSGAPNIRPAWFFDTAEQGEGLNDIGTHLVDLVQWTLFPDQAIDYRRDVKVLSASAGRLKSPKRISGASPASRLSRAPVGERQGRTARVLLQHVGHRTRCANPRGAQCDLGLGGAAGGGDTHYARYRGRVARDRGTADAS